MDYIEIAQVRQEGNRRVKRTMVYYNLDMIISVGGLLRGGKASARKSTLPYKLRSPDQSKSLP